MMRRQTTIWFVTTALAVVALVCLRITPLLAQTPPPLNGVWSGRLETPGTPLSINVTLERTSDGWSGTIDVPAQRIAGSRLADVTVDGSTLSFRLTVGGGNPHATLQVSDDGQRMNGTFTQGGGSIPIVLARGGAAASAPPAPSVRNRPQTPRRPFAYVEENVTYRNEPAGITLAGTLTHPQGRGPFPAVVLITGSGAQDRDESIFDHKPFLVLADVLTKQGLAVLRVDDRGVGGSDPGPATATTRDFAGDVRAGVAFLKGRADVDATRIGLIGHSEGGGIAPMVAADLPEIRFIVLMAGPGVPGDQILYLQAAAALKLSGASSDVIAWDRLVRERVIEQVKAETNGVADIAKRRAVVDSMPPAPGTPGSTGQQTATTLFAAYSVAWFRSFLADDPAATLRRVRCPVLAVIGENDTQVPARENLPAIRAALEAGGNRDVTVTSLPRLNHLFQTSATGAVSEYATIEETLAPSFLTLLTDWLTPRLR
jgi:pimeloyl-ACP methyl ester carboxylesterase